MFQQAFCWNKAFEGGHCAKVCRESFLPPPQHCPSTPECPEILPIKSRIAEGSSSLDRQPSPLITNGSMRSLLACTWELTSDNPFR